MSDAKELPEFDVIVIGAGAAGGLPVGAYLQKAGAKVLLVDGNNTTGIHCRSYEYYGGAKCVPCAGGFAGGMMPLWDDLELEEHGAEMLLNRRIFGCIYPDNTSLFIGADALRTLKDIAKFSVKDAWTFARIAKRMEEVRVEFNEVLIYSEPKPEHLLRAYELLAYCLRMTVAEVQSMNAFELLDHLFEDDRMKQVLFQPGGSVCLFNPWNKGEGAMGTDDAALLFGRPAEGLQPRAGGVGRARVLQVRRHDLAELPRGARRGRRRCRDRYPDEGQLGYAPRADHPRPQSRSQQYRYHRHSGVGGYRGDQEKPIPTWPQ